MDADRLRRAREIGVAGLARRFAQRARRSGVARARARWHATYCGAGPTDAVLLAALDPSLLPASEPGAHFAHARNRVGGGGARFFLDTADPSLPSAFAGRHAAAKARILREADATLAGDLGWVVPGGTLDWHAALPGGGTWPRRASDQLEVGAARPIGDVRLSWEVSRCTHVVRLAQAAWLTRESRYARAVADEVQRFVAENPPGIGIAWAHAQEVGIRAVAWLWAFRLTRDLGAFDADAFRAWLWLVLAHGDYVAAHLAEHPVTHNHLVSEAAALAVLGLALPEVRAAAQWRSLGLGVLWRELRKQVDAEGVHGEHSTHYHAFVLDSFVAVLLLAERLRESVPRSVRERIAAMAEFVAVLSRSDGTLPAIGDTDAGRAWRLGGDPLDRRDLLAAAAVAFDRRDFGAIAGDAPGAFWITGGRPIPGAGDAPPRGCARRFCDAGIGIARTGFDAGAEIVVLRCGPTRFRPDVLRSHMHADATSVLWRAGDEDLLVDPGTHLYSEGSGWRAWLRGTAAHSCVVVDGRDQADVRSQRFGISGERPARWLSFDGDATQLLASAEHPADGTPRVRRRLAWVAGGFLALCDEVLGTGSHRVEAWLQFPSTSGQVDGLRAALRLPSGRALGVLVSGDAEEIEVMRPALDAGPGPGWIAPRYGTRVPGTALQIRAGTRTLPVRIVTVLRLTKPGEVVSFAEVTTRPDGGVRVGAGGRSACFGADGTLRLEPMA